MKRNIKLTIEYDGTLYQGWQVQARDKDSKTIQGTLEAVLQRILQEQVKVVGSGRTDAGVHANGQVANFNTRSDINLEKLKRALNSLLPQDIVVTEVKEAALDFHSRFYVKSKVYRYTILNRKFPSAILRNTVYFYPRHLNISRMKISARLLLGRHDFKSFQTSSVKERNTIRQIKKIRISKNKDLIYIDIETDGFLRGMVRTIAGTLIEIGRGKPIDMKRLLAIKDRRKAGPTAPAKGLCLMKVKY